MIHKAYKTLKALSADEETRELAERREKALKDEAMFLNEAKKTGRKEGIREGIQKGKRENKKEIALRLIDMNLLTADQIAEATGLEVWEVERLKSSDDSTGNE